MSGSNRGGNDQALDWALPLIGIILALSLAWAVGWLQAREEYKREQTPLSYQAAAQKDAERACIGTDPSAVFRCVSEKVETAYQTAHDEQDLSAQQRAASSSLASAVLSFLALALSGVGVWYVKRTLDATLEAVEDTGKATKAMERQNELAENTAKRQLRAYLYVELKEAPKLELGGRPMGEFWLKNGGQTPAYHVRVANAFSIGRYPFEGEPEPIMEHLFGGSSTKNPNAPSVLLCKSPDGGITQPWIDAINAGTRRIVMYGEIRYDDIFGDPHVTTYRAEFGGPDTVSGDCVIWGETGNTST